MAGENQELILTTNSLTQLVTRVKTETSKKQNKLNTTEGCGVNIDQETNSISANSIKLPDYIVDSGLQQDAYEIGARAVADAESGSLVSSSTVHVDCEEASIVYTSSASGIDKSVTISCNGNDTPTINMIHEGPDALNKLCIDEQQTVLESENLQAQFKGRVSANIPSEDKASVNLDVSQGTDTVSSMEIDPSHVSIEKKDPSSVNQYSTITVEDSRISHTSNEHNFCILDISGKSDEIVKIVGYTPPETSLTIPVLEVNGILNVQTATSDEDAYIHNTNVDANGLFLLDNKHCQIKVMDNYVPSNTASETDSDVVQHGTKTAAAINLENSTTGSMLTLNAGGAEIELADSKIITTVNDIVRKFNQTSKAFEVVPGTYDASRVSIRSTHIEMASSKTTYSNVSGEEVVMDEADADMLVLGPKGCGYYTNSISSSRIYHPFATVDQLQSIIPIGIQKEIAVSEWTAATDTDKSSNSNVVSALNLSMPDITADPLEYIITIMPAANSMQEFVDCGVMMINESEGILRLGCAKTPTKPITVYFTIQYTNYHYESNSGDPYGIYQKPPKKAQLLKSV